MGLKQTFKALSDSNRRKILELINPDPKSAGEIAEQFDMTPATVSYHLNQLKKADLIRETKYKNFIYYELNTSVFEEVLLWIKNFEKGESSDEK